MKNINWTTVIVALILIAAVVGLSLAGKQVPDELKALLSAAAVALAAMLRSALQPPPPPVA